jgi:beta-glucosidase
VVQAGKDGTPSELNAPLGSPLTAIGWLVLPEALYWGPRFICERYGLPLVITENGVSCRDWVSLDQRVHDPARIDFTHKYLLELARAIEHGTPVNAYFHWSLLDNFEWAEGFKERFGLVFVDFASGRRILKDSARWYRKLIASNGALLRPEPQRLAAPAEAE